MTPSLAVVALLLAAPAKPPPVPADSRGCVDCHRRTTPALVQQWLDSAHARKGLGCIQCHAAKAEDADGFDHHGARIATIASPLDCSRCHEKEFKQQQASRHANAASFIGSLDNVLGEVVEGGPAAIMGCQQCHGSTVKTLANGRLDPTTWPNGGVGRVNPDGSKGSCAACHYRHDFSLAIARGPDTCGKCHMGPDHPQIEIYNESKHGIRFREQHDQMNLSAKKWVVGSDYTAAPTCATCHMSATPTQEVTHDVGDRISWTLRPVISTRAGKWEDRRELMTDVCNQCHAEKWTQAHFTQFDNLVTLYNTKFAQPAKGIMDALYADKKLTKTPFDEDLEFTYFELWHHEGRRARHGAAMMGPDFTQWHGMYEVAKHFYTKLVPEAERLKPGVTKPFLASPEHAWRKGLDPEMMKQQLEFYKKRYGTTAQP